jgi:cellulose 1,4-beta-cellobiosidase
LIRESNSHSFALTPHPCENNAYHVCETDGCGGTYSADRFAGDCDANGCDYNPYRNGVTDFYGKGKTVDTSKKFTVVTQFAQNNLTQFFVQDGVQIDIPAPAFDGFPDESSITPEYCEDEVTVFGDRDRFSEVGGFSKVNSALTSNPMVLVMSIWDDVSDTMFHKTLGTNQYVIALRQHALARLFLPC